MQVFGAPRVTPAGSCFFLALVVLIPGGKADTLVHGGVGAGSDDGLVAAAVAFFSNHADNATSVVAQGGEGEPAIPGFANIQAKLQPVFATLSPSEDGLLGATAVRYILHRFFVQEHSWFVEGLDPEGQAWNESSPTQAKAFAGLPPSIRALIAQRIHGSGLALREVAAFAALLERVIDLDATARLRVVYDKLGLPTDRSIDAGRAESALDAYMSCHIAGKDPAKLSTTKIRRVARNINKIYPNWPATRDYVRERLWRGVVDDRVDFASMCHAVQEIGKHWGNFQGSECSELLGVLTGLGDKATGRVRLADFYGGALHGGKWQFAENIPYLRRLGALDESNPSNMRVIIPNYIEGRSNCVGVAGSYSNCCVSKCLAILRHLEEQLGAPEALPADILPLVAALPSQTVPANRVLPDLMVIRLKKIAADHGGMVTLHSRGFSQWLHHAYPMECPYPHLSGTTEPLELMQWMSKVHTSPTASPKDMRQFAEVSSHGPVRGRSTGPLAGPVETAPWSDKEEIYVPPAPGHPMAWAALNGAVFIAAVAIFTMGIMLMRTARGATRALNVRRRTGLGDVDAKV